MVAAFYPWKMELDTDATKRLYSRRSFAADPAANAALIAALTPGQREFFASLGVDPARIRADEKTYTIPADGGLPAVRLHRLTIDFLLCVKFLAIPDYQRELYGDAELFGDTLPASLAVEVMPEDGKLPLYDVDGWGVVFKHPCLHMEDAAFQSWDCGYLLGSVLLMKEV